MTTTFQPRRTRWLEVAAILALFLVIQVLADETGKFKSFSSIYLQYYSFYFVRCFRLMEKSTVSNQLKS